MLDFSIFAPKYTDFWDKVSFSLGVPFDYIAVFVLFEILLFPHFFFHFLTD
jgi:hypothetical protein